MSFPFLQPYAGLGNSLQTAQAAVGGGAVGGWVELGRTTLGSVNSDIDVTSLSDKRYYMILINGIGYSGTANTHLRFNSDSGTNYSYRLSIDGGADNTGTSSIATFAHGNSSTNNFGVGYVSNLSSKEKLVLSHNIRQNTAGAANPPIRSESVSKWANTSSAISGINATTASAATHGTGSECVVLGWDPADTHTSNFWEELASVELGVAGDTLSSSTITAKKYLCVQVFTKATGGTIQQRMRFNSDAGSNYAERYSQDGGTDGTIINDEELLLSAAPSTPAFTNMFIINNQSNEKLLIGHNVNQGGAGAANDPERYEIAHKWANTSNQITQIDIINTGSGNFDTGSIIKVWGAD
jgi:hypothetical protein